MPADDIYRASINTQVNGVNTLNVFHFKQLDADGAETPADSLKAGLETIVLPTWVPMLSNECLIASVAIRQILPAVDQPFVYSFAGGAGTVAQKAEPPNLCVVATHYTNDNSRTGRGRNYFAGVAQTLITKAVPTGAFVALFQTFKTALLGPFIDAGSGIHWQMQHYSPFNDDASDVIHIEQRMQLRVLRSRITN